MVLQVLPNFAVSCRNLGQLIVLKGCLLLQHDEKEAKISDQGTKEAQQSCLGREKGVGSFLIFAEMTVFKASKHCAL